MINYLTVLLLLLLHLNVSAASLPDSKLSTQPLSITYTDEDYELTASCYPADSDETLLFLPSVYASMEDQEAYAKEIAEGNLAACISHMLTDLFLPMKNGSYNEVPEIAMLGLFNLVQQRTGKPIYLVAHGSGNRLAYRLAALVSREQKHEHYGSPVKGLIMLSPNLLDHTPEPGEQPVYMPQVHQQTLPLYIFQPVYSPHHYHLETLLQHIRTSGTRVSFERIKNVRDGYALREDRSDREQQLRDQGAAIFQRAIGQIKHEG